MKPDDELLRLAEPPAFNIDLSLNFENAKPLQLANLWDSKRRGERLPARRDFLPEELKEHFGWLCVVEFVERRDDLIYALIGTRIVDFVGRDITRKRVSETLPGVALRIFLHLAERPRPVRTWGELDWVDKAFFQHETLVLPLADDGKVVDRFLLHMMFY